MPNSKFAREFSKLNSEQKAAVEAIEGPVMVLAGPGTGKTQVVAMRIGQILSKTQATARNILALTFTEAGVTALRKRLIDIIGPDAYQVTIATFHGFANEVISTFAYAFLLPNTASNLDEIEIHQIIDRIVADSTNLKLLRPARLPNFHVGAIISAIKTLKQEDTSPQELLKLAKLNFKESQKDRSKIAEAAAERNLAVLTELASIYKQYLAHLESERLYDYEDMILLVRNAIETKPEIKQYLQERYQYILVDEYQDTNNSQNALTEALANFFDQPNLCVVGDDKQAIYRFQGASVANMLHFIHKYPNIKIVRLKKNYRNPAGILRSATQLIANNRQQISDFLKDKSELVSATTVQSEPRLISFASRQSQYSGIVHYCQARLKQGQPPDQIAVLFRSNIEVAEFSSVANQLGLATTDSSSSNLVGEPIIRGLLNILNALNEPTNVYRVLAALPYLDQEVTAVEISLSLKGRNRNTSLLDGLISQRKVPAVAEAAKKFRQLLIQQKSLKLTEFLYQLVQACHLTSTNTESLNINQGLNINQLEIIHGFLDRAKLLVARQPSLGVKGLVEYFQLLQKYQMTIPVKKSAPESGSVVVSTVHRAKGLEFDTVIMGNVGADSWKVRVNRSTIKLPSNIVKVDSWREDQLEDERRLFYVGMTRSKKELILSFSLSRDSGQETLPSQFLTEIDSGLKKEESNLSQNDATKTLKALLNPEPIKQLSSMHNKYIKELISQSPFSYTHYRSYLTCPRQYLLRNVLKLPELPSFSLQFGSAVHKALELYFKQFNQTKTKPSQERLLQFFEDALEKSLSGAELKRAKSDGTMLLEAYYEQKSADWQLPVGVEYSFYTHHVELDGVWLTGKFDRIDPLDPVARTVRVVDYKTGSKPKTRGQIEGTTKDSEGEIKQQLVFYALLAKHDRLFPFRVRELMISSIDDAGKFNDEIFTVTADEIKALEIKILETHKEILSRSDFPHLGPNYERGCELCALF